MPYKSVQELPAQVKKALNNNASRMHAFLRAYNAAAKSGKSEQACFRIAYSAASKVKAEEAMPAVVAYLDAVSLEDVEIDEEDGQPTIEIPIAPANAKYKHPWFGDVVFNKKVLQQFQDNFNNKTLGVDIALDVSHQPDRGAIGWFLELVDKGKQGLWAVVELTDEGLDLVRNRKYKYISPEFATKWTNPRTGDEYENVLFGAAVTNRPFLRDMDALLVFEDETVSFESLDLSVEGGEEGMDPKILAMLGLSEDAEDTQVYSAIEALVTARREAEQKDAETRQFAEMFPEQAAALETLTQRLNETTVNALMTEWTSTGKYGLPPVVLEDVKSFRMSMTDAQGATFDSIIAKLTESGLVPLGIKGTTGAGTDPEDTTSDSQKFQEIVEGLMKDESLKFNEALRKAEADHPELAEAYANDRPKLDVITTDEGGE